MAGALGSSTITATSEQAAIQAGSRNPGLAVTGRRDRPGPAPAPVRVHRAAAPLPRARGLVLIAGGAATALTLGLLPGVAAAQTGPVHCVTTVESRLAPTRGTSATPGTMVQVTRCQPLEPLPDLLQRRAYTWTSPYSKGVDVVHQITGALGISLAGDSGDRVMGLGFADQTLIWDAAAIENTSALLLERQLNPMPLRTRDLASVFDSSLASGAASVDPQTVEGRGPYAPTGGSRIRSLR